MKKKKREEKPARFEAWWRWALASLGGCLVFLAFPNFDLCFLGWVAVVPTLLAVQGCSRKQTFLLGLWAGTITNAVGFYWITGMLQDFGHMSLIPALLINLLMAAYQGLMWAVWLLLLDYLRSWFQLRYWVLAPIAFVAIEYLWWMIFPWYFANSQYRLIPMIQICELGGVTLLSFLLVMVNGAWVDAYQAFRAQHRRRALGTLGLATLVIVANLVYGLIRMSAVDDQVDQAPKLKIGLVEADVGIWEKEDPRKIKDNLVTHQRLSIELAQQGAELIVWPETSYHAPLTFARRRGQKEMQRFRPIPHDVEQIAQSDSSPPLHAVEDQQARTPLADRVAPQRGFRTPLLFGALTFRLNPQNPSQRHPGVDYLNSAILLDENGTVLGLYHKVYLLMFGEHIPLSETFPVFYKWLPEAGDLTPGSQVKVLPFRDHRIGIMVCYEDIIPDFIRKVAAHDPNLLINVTNDAWFGKTAEPYLHMALSVFRTVESRLSLIRSTNTGVSCFIDPTGRIRKQTQLDHAETLLDQVPMMAGGTLYQSLGDWPAWLCILAVIGLVSFRWRQIKQNRT